MTYIVKPHVRVDKPEDLQTGMWNMAHFLEEEGWVQAQTPNLTAIVVWGTSLSFSGFQFTHLPYLLDDGLVYQIKWCEVMNKIIYTYSRG